MQNFFYSSIAGIALVVHLIINWKQLLDWRNVKTHAGAAMNWYTPYATKPGSRICLSIL